MQVTYNDTLKRRSPLLSIFVPLSLPLPKSGPTGSNNGNGDSIILEEEIDPNYEPTEDEVLEYAKWLGAYRVGLRISKNANTFLFFKTSCLKCITHIVCIVFYEAYNTARH
jgi:hypothetical protein